MRVFLFILCFITITLCYSQDRFDQQWILRGTIRLDFKDNQLNIDTISPFSGKVYPGEHATTMNSELGDLLFYSGGCEIINADHLQMINGDSLNPGARELGYCKSGSLPWDQGLIMIPFPDHINQYITFTLDVGAPFDLEDTIHFGLVPLHVYYHLISQESDSSVMKVVLKNISILSDTLSRGYLQITRHGNGRDWWLIAPEWNSNCYYTLLISPSGIDSIGKSCDGFNYGDHDLAGMAHISPNGEKYARCSGQDIRGIQVLDFDRCSGQFSNYKLLSIPESEMYFTGIGFSPDSRFLYVTTRLHVWQFDLYEQDIQSSVVLVGEILPEEITPKKGLLYHQEIGPDGRIYIASPGSHAFLSTINMPNNRGLACDFRAYNIAFPEMLTNYRALPNNVFFRLGPQDGSSCDSIGINNVPVANFRYEIDSLNPLLVHYTNLSYYEPNDFSWEFGDTNSDETIDPSHIYSSPGDYYVCLTASNEYGINLTCKEISLKTTSVNLGNSSHFISWFPNPVQDRITIYVDSNYDLPLDVNIFNLLGQSVYQFRISEKESSLYISDLTNGLYFMNVHSNKEFINYTSPVFILNK